MLDEVLDRESLDLSIMSIWGWLEEGSEALNVDFPETIWLGTLLLLLPPPKQLVNRAQIVILEGVEEDQMGKLDMSQILVFSVSIIFLDWYKGLE
jgi:hypothetical protein